MPDISVSDLQAIAVDCTSRFLNEGVPLSTSLAKQASDRGLNLDQLQRAVEATNTLTHLKCLEVGNDRTHEFPVADTNQILKMACLPSAVDHEKTAQAAVSEGPLSLEKKAELAESLLLSAAPYQMSKPEAYAWFQKQAAANERRLEDLRAEAITLPSRITKLAAEIALDPSALDKMASQYEGKDFNELCALTFGEVKPRPTYAEFLFTKSASSTDRVVELKGLVDRAKEVQAGITKCAALKKEADLVKKAFAPLLGSIARSIGGGLAGGVSKGMKLLTKPITATAKGAVKVINPFESGAIGGIKTRVANTAWGEKKGLTNMGPVKPLFNKKRLAAAGTVAGAAFDAASYSPSVDPAGDMSGSVWAATQPKL
jgi:hypothetical protein